MKQIITQLLKQSIQTKEKLIAHHLDDIARIVSLSVNSLKKGGKLIFCGNGGSAADSQHLAAELVVRFKKNRKSLPALALTTNTSILTAIGNDYGFDAIFARQLESLANKNDVLFAISTSGTSSNVLEAVKTAKKLKIKTIALTGAKGKHLAGRCDAALIVPDTDTARIQEAHACIGHILCELIEKKLCP